MGEPLTWGKSCIRSLVKALPLARRLVDPLNSQIDRDEFVHRQLSLLAAGSLILDAGCGSQRYRAACGHLRYRAQDCGEYIVDQKRIIGSIGIGGEARYRYGPLDYVGDVWNIKEEPRTFDAILCTEVFEHIPYPVEAVREFSRLLKGGGVLILTAPANCLRHMDPFFFYSGFSDHWYEKVLREHGFNIESLEAIGDYYSWIAAEVLRTGRAHSMLAAILLAPTFLYLRAKRKTAVSVDTLCMGYHVLAHKQV
jgi:SAM-dependent methyltransferase